ncbi:MULTISPECIES: DUF4282 domain-containing protein [Alkalibacterium]|uniref:DUF4282 domain-containing protein n=2 Tax=Alkalibacterium TaxID=99906 RepID=A0A511AS29_9LACT|nr:MULTISPECIES: DUF4282 domain-containing protein [Alkalibacterium]GEK89684.1 hypothetical protein APU01nite_17230 [Alkalibacterium putridalgicola]GEK90998.1 hypothetical protein AKA01nite_06200 [Alkalibacterium kapii]SEM03078.1 protein of unknown function [Alkalibacterium putridalgicola]
MNYNAEKPKDSFFNFDTMITPKIIQIIFYIGLAVSIVSGLTTIISGDSVFLGLAILIIGPLVIRVNCELVIVIFKIHEALQDMRYR